MDHETDEQNPSSTEGGEMKCKVGDWVWVKGQIKNTKFGATETEVEICEQRVYVRIFDCRPEAEMLDWSELITKHIKGIEVQGE